MTTDVIITGTGVPNVAPGRAGAGVLVRHGDCLLQIDAGRATTLRLVEAGVSTGSLTALFVTHHHSDHLVGLEDLLFTRWVENHGHHTRLPVVAPEGPCVTYLERMMDPWADDIEIRQVHAGRTDPPDPEIVAFSPGTDLIPPPRNEADEASMTDEVRGAGYQGAIIVARDLTKVSL